MYTSRGVKSPFPIHQKNAGEMGKTGGISELWSIEARGIGPGATVAQFGCSSSLIVDVAWGALRGWGGVARHVLVLLSAAGGRGRGGGGEGPDP